MTFGDPVFKNPGRYSKRNVYVQNCDICVQVAIFIFPHFRALFSTYIYLLHLDINIFAHLILWRVSYEGQEIIGLPTKWPVQSSWCGRLDQHERTIRLLSSRVKETRPDQITCVRGLEILLGTMGNLRQVLDSRSFRSHYQSEGQDAVQKSLFCRAIQAPAGAGRKNGKTKVRLNRHSDQNA